jgi:hypothetical protein
MKNSDSVNSLTALDPTCIICLSDTDLISSQEPKICQCVFHYHLNCLNTWHTKHSAQCPLCRKMTNFYTVGKFGENAKKEFRCSKYCLIIFGVFILFFAVFIVYEMTRNK